MCVVGLSSCCWKMYLRCWIFLWLMVIICYCFRWKVWSVRIDKHSKCCWVQWYTTYLNFNSYVSHILYNHTHTQTNLTQNYPICVSVSLYYLWWCDSVWFYTYIYMCVLLCMCTGTWWPLDEGIRDGVVYAIAVREHFLYIGGHFTFFTREGTRNNIIITIPEFSWTTQIISNNK